MALAVSWGAEGRMGGPGNKVGAAGVGKSGAGRDAGLPPFLSRPSASTLLNHSFFKQVQ